MAIRNLGGEIFYDWQADRKGDYDQLPKPPSPVWLQELMGIDFMSDVVSVAEGSWCGRDLWARVTDVDLVHLHAFPRLRKLDLSGASGTVAWADPERELLCVILTMRPWQEYKGFLLRRIANVVQAAIE